MTQGFDVIPARHWLCCMARFFRHCKENYEVIVRPQSQEFVIIS
ncbi:hypothetical protein RAMDARK_1601 [Rickettsia amblyommatis str. Darkwater]|nr:hypothetical protein RAMDARK_1601 [Rickettsia amblyommatis str. Darkwater]